MEEKTTKKTEMVEIEAFGDGNYYKDDVFIAVNGKSIVVKRGEKVKVAKKYAEVFENSKIQDNATIKMMNEKSDQYNAETKKYM